MHRTVALTMCAWLAAAAATPAAATEAAAPTASPPSLVIATLSAPATVAAPSQVTTVPESEEAGDGSIRTLIKAVSYQTFSSLNDFAFGYFYGGGLLAGGLLVLANAMSETAVTFVHDKLWSEAVGDNPEAEDASRSSRTATYTSINLVRTFMMGRVVAGSALVGGIYMALNAVNDAVVYAGNDLIFANIWPAGTGAPDWGRFFPFLAAAESQGELPRYTPETAATLPVPKR